MGPMQHFAAVVVDVEYFAPVEPHWSLRHSIQVKPLPSLHAHSSSFSP
jgi:hypothetical protein